MLTAAPCAALVVCWHPPWAQACHEHIRASKRSEPLCALSKRLVVDCLPPCCCWARCVHQLLAERGVWRVPVKCLLSLWTGVYHM